MSYSPSEHVEDCKRAVKAAQLVAKHYPDAYREKRGDAWQWCHEGALKNATGFTIETREKDGEVRAVFCPFHMLVDGDVRTRVYATGWEGHVEQWDMLRRIEERPDLHAAIMALLKDRR